MDPDRSTEVLTSDALAFLRRLHAELDSTRRELLLAREVRQAELDAGASLGPIVERPGDWSVAPVPAGLQDRRVEITGPTDRKMVINALNSGARGFMADFEDANSPTWSNMIGGQANLMDAVRGTIALDEGEKSYRLGDDPATLLVRPRGLHLPERHLAIEGDAIAGAFFDFGLYVFHNAVELLERGAGPWFYLPKLESHDEARLWRNAFVLAEDELGLDRGTIRATVLIETLPAAFEMEAILHELRDHAAGLNAGRWDYIFSTIKRFRHREDFVLPDRSEVKMTVPFMRAYTELLVKTCHRRGAHAMGGMAAVIPSRRDPEANERAYAAVREDKRREANDGFDGTWVAHPDSVEVAMAEFDAVLGDRSNQVDRRREEVSVSGDDLLDVAATPGDITDEGLRANVSVGVAYIDSWLGGNGAAAINGLMEDAATAEISRSQVWQWLRHERVSEDAVRAALEAEPAGPARELFERVALSGREEFVEFLTLPAYERLEG